MSQDPQGGLIDRSVAPAALLLVAAAASVAIANSAFADDFARLLGTQIGWTGAPFGLRMSIADWIKDGLMAVFFFGVGLELKRECIDGELKDLRQAGLPLAGAVGGMAAPAAIYFGFNGAAHATSPGWGIPMATDIAFALGALALLGRRIAPSLRAFLLALAIVDDLGAILVIALFYGGSLNLFASAVAVILFGVGLAFNRLGVTRLWPYALLALPLWFAVHHSGVHAAIAGVALATTIPYRTPATLASEVPPLLVAEHGLSGWIAYGILPVFALANAGVSFSGLTPGALVEPVTLGIALGLLIGKPAGVVLGAGVAAKILRTRLPASFGAMTGIGLVAGIGFTMSLFIGALAFETPQLLAETRIGVFLGSIAAAALGLLLLRSVLSIPSGPAGSDPPGLGS